jgi:hypothetical protein
VAGGKELDVNVSLVRRAVGGAIAFFVLGAAGLLAVACSGPAPSPPAPPSAAAPASAVAPTSADAPSGGDVADESSWPPAPVVPLTSPQPPPTVEVDQPLPDQLAMGLVVIRYRAHNLRIVPVFGPNALDVTPRIGHIHVTVDDAPWHWADASGEPLIIQFLPPGPHKVWIGLADPTHRILDSKTLSFVVPPRATDANHH